jgi:hypothetical protein
MPVANRSDRELRDKMIFPWQQNPIGNHFQKWCHKYALEVFQKWTSRVGMGGRTQNMTRGRISSPGNLNIGDHI